MKLLSIILIVWGLFAEEHPQTLSDIDFNPRILKRDISSVFNEKNPTFDEINIPDSLVEELFMNGKFFQIKNNISTVGIVYVGRVNSCRKEGCSNPSKTNLEETSEFFDYFILFNTKSEVKKVTVFNYEATHGQEITAKGWLKQFIGYRGDSEMDIGKNIDSISGATISVNGIVHDVKMKTQLIQKMFN